MDRVNPETRSKGHNQGNHDQDSAEYIHHAAHDDQEKILTHPPKETANNNINSNLGAGFLIISLMNYTAAEQQGICKGNETPQATGS
jgi:hypothetical protein